MAVDELEELAAQIAQRTLFSHAEARQFAAAGLASGWTPDAVYAAAVNTSQGLELAGVELAQMSPELTPYGITLNMAPIRTEPPRMPGDILGGSA